MKMSVILGHIPVIPLLNAGILLAVFSVTVVLDQIKIAHQVCLQIIIIWFHEFVKGNESIWGIFFLYIFYTDCMVDNSLHSDGSQWFDNCQSCHCHKGVVTCEIQSCNCSNSNSLKEVIPDHCCPQCPPRQQDSNVEQPPPSKCLYLDREGVPLLNYHHGQKWLSQCQECECMVRSSFY